MAATNLQMNWSSVALLVGNTTTTFTRVDTVNFDEGGQLIGYSGDANVYNVALVNSMNDPKATINTSNPGQLLTLTVGTAGTLTATLNDAKLATSGAINYTLANAVVSNVTNAAQHAQYGTGTVIMEAYSADGTTNPLGFTRS